jgi:hypothetical protein
MRRWLRPGRAVAVSVLVAMAVLIAIAFGTPAAHEIHSAGATDLHPQLASTNPPVYDYPPIQPSQSLDTIRCEIWTAHHQNASPCPDTAALAQAYFPDLTQRPTTLYVPWTPCPTFNVEFLPQGRTVVIHCYSARPWIYAEPRAMGTVAAPLLGLLLIPTQSIPAGQVDVVEDFRTEHVLGDSSYEFQVGTATIY